jgi:hypothetical protein
MEEYSANAIRMADYGAREGSPKGTYGNRVYDNKIYIKAINFPEPASYIPLTWAFFYSASAGDNYIFGNDIVIDHTDPKSKARAAAFYISGGSRGLGGRFYNNRITSNVAPIWVAGQYGGTNRTVISDNIIIKSPGALPDYTPFKMGFSGCESCIALNVSISGNEIRNDSFAIHVEGKGHSYRVSWHCSLQLKDRKGQPLANHDWEIIDSRQTYVAMGKTNERGMLQLILPQYDVEGDQKTLYTPYTLVVGKFRYSFDLKENKNTVVTVF